MTDTLTLDDEQALAIQTIALSFGLFEPDINGDPPSDPKVIMEVAQEFVRQSRLARKAGNQSQAVAEILSIAEVDAIPPDEKQLQEQLQAPPPTPRGEPERMATSTIPDLTNYPVEMLRKFEASLENYPESEERTAGLTAVRAELASRGEATAAPASEFPALPPAPQDPLIPSEEQKAERAALEDRLTIKLMREHSLDPSQVETLTTAELRAIVDGVPAPAAAPVAPAPEPSAPQPAPPPVAMPPGPPQYTPEQLARITALAGAGPPPIPASIANNPIPTSDDLSPEREALEAEISGPALKCVAAGQRVLMADGTAKLIESLRIGDLVLSSDGERITTDTVSAVWHSGYKGIKKVRLSDGRQVRVSSEHPISGWDDWIPAGDLIVNDVVCVASVTDQVITGLSDVSRDDAFLLALWLAEGLKNVRRYQRFSYTNATPEIHERVQQIADRRGWKMTIRAREIERSIVGRKNDRITSPTAFLHSFGLGDVLVDTIFVPDAIKRANKEIVSEFIGTFIACDGSIAMNKSGRSNSGIKADSASERMVRDLQILAARLGVRSTVGSSNAPSREGYRTVWTWRVATIDEIRELKKHVYVPGKQHKFDAMIDSIELRKSFACQLPPQFRDTLRVKTTKSGPRSQRGSWMTREKAQRLLALPQNSVVAERVERVLTGGLGWAKVREVADDGLDYTYDIETERDHCFFVEGVLTHNSWGRGRRDVPKIGDHELALMIEHPDARVGADKLAEARRLDAGGAPAVPPAQMTVTHETLGPPQVDHFLPDPAEQLRDEAREGQVQQPEPVLPPSPFTPPPAPPETPKPAAQVASAPLSAPIEIQIDPQRADRIIANEHLPIPPTIEAPPELPADMSKLSKDDLYSLHARFHTAECRVDWLLTNEEGDLADIRNLLRARKVEVANALPVKDGRTKITDAQRDAMIAADDGVVSYQNAEHEVSKTVRKLKALAASYHSSVERASRQMTRYSSEYGSSAK